MKTALYWLASTAAALLVLVVVAMAMDDDGTKPQRNHAAPVQSSAPTLPTFKVQ